MESGDELDGLKRVLKNSTTLDKNKCIHTVFCGAMLSIVAPSIHMDGDFLDPG